MTPIKIIQIVDKSNLILELPENMVGKKVEITIKVIKLSRLIVRLKFLYNKLRQQRC